MEKLPNIYKRSKLIYLEKFPVMFISLNQLLPNILGNFSDFVLIVHAGACFGGPVSPLLRFLSIFTTSFTSTLDWSPIQMVAVTARFLVKW